MKVKIITIEEDFSEEEFIQYFEDIKSVKPNVEFFIDKQNWEIYYFRDIPQIPIIGTTVYSDFGGIMEVINVYFSLEDGVETEIYIQER